MLDALGKTSLIGFWEPSTGSADADDVSECSQHRKVSRNLAHSSE